jgi:hypothetical protein
MLQRHRSRAGFFVGGKLFRPAIALLLPAGAAWKDAGI